MRAEAFLKRLNAHADIVGEKPISTRMLEDWAYEDLITGPTQIGGGWDWSERSLAEAQNVLDYRSRGFKRATAVKAQWWLEGREFPVHLVRESIISEYKRARNLALRFVSSIHGMRRDVELTEYRRLALRRQLGPLDERLKAAGFDFGAAVVIYFYEIARFGEQITAIDEDAEPIAALLAKAVLPNGLHAFAGFLEPDDENFISAARALNQLSNKQFAECRDMIAFFPIGLILGQIGFALLKKEDEAKQRAYEAAINSYSKWPWSIITFAFVANVYYLSQMEKTSAS